MCIIVAKRKTTPIPTLETLRTCFENNPDGAGFMYYSPFNNKVVIDKGYMTWKTFKKRYKKLCTKYNNFENKSLVMHFRIGTAGSNSAKNTHPFPVSENLQDTQKTYFLTDLGITHNGIISEYNPPKSNITDTTDTIEFIRKFLAPIYKGNKEFYKDNNIMDGLGRFTNSRFTLLDTNDDLYLINDFVSDENGVLYSNNTYKVSYWNSYNYNYFNNYTSAKDYNYIETNWHEEYDDELPKLKDIDSEKEYLRGKLTPLKRGMIISYYNGDTETVDNDDIYYYDFSTGTLYDDSDGDMEKAASDIYVFNIIDDVWHEVY